MQIDDEVVLRSNWNKIRLKISKEYNAANKAICNKANMINVPLNYICKVTYIHRDGDIGINHPKASGYMYAECFVLLNKNRRLLND